MLAQSLQALVKQRWTGTAQELLDELGPSVKVAGPKALSDDLRRLAPMLRTIGIDVRFEKRLNVTRPITITLEYAAYPDLRHPRHPSRVVGWRHFSGRMSARAATEPFAGRVSAGKVGRQVTLLRYPARRLS